MPNFQRHHARSHKIFFYLFERSVSQYWGALSHKAAGLSRLMFSDAYLFKALRLCDIVRSEVSARLFGRFSYQAVCLAITMPICYSQH